jgi:hypothetical protein
MPDEQQREAPKPDRQYPRVDWLLVELVELANRAERGRFGLTVMLGGATITGTLIGSREYYTLYGEVLASTISDAAAKERVRKKWVDYGELARQNLLKEMEAAETKGEFAHISFLHMKDSRVVNGGQFVPAEGGMLLRIRLTEVQSFAPQPLGLR